MDAERPEQRSTAERWNEKGSILNPKEILDLSLCGRSIDSPLRGKKGIKIENVKNAE